MKSRIILRSYSQANFEPYGFQGFSEEEWQANLRRSDLYQISQARLKESLITGIPPHLRGQIWAFVSKADRLAARFSVKTYHRLTKQVNPSELVLINKDLHRTFPDHDLFKVKGGQGQTSLLNILTAYTAYDNEVGYCQGEGFIVGILLMQMEREEMVFWTFVQIMFEKNWRLVFKSGTPKLVSMLESLSRQIKHRLPEVHKHFLTEGAEIMICFSQYFITLFMYDTPIPMSMRIMDLFLLEGEQVLFNLIIKMLLFKREKVLALNGQYLYTYLRSRLVRECYDEYHLATLLSPVSEMHEEVELMNL